MEGAALMASVQAPAIGGQDMPKLRVRAENLDQLWRNAGYESAEDLIRAADISRSAWHNLKTPDKQKAVNLRVLANLMGALRMHRLDELVEYIPDVPPADPPRRRKDDK